MEQKKYEIVNCLRSIFGNRYSSKFLSFKAINSSNNGFTLTELLIVIAVVGILAAASISAINPIAQLQKARDNDRKADLKYIQTALELYRSDAGAYPQTSFTAATELKSADGNTTYISKMPKDPKSGGNYTYTYNAAAGTYTVSACAERLTNSSEDVYADATCTKGFRIIFYSP